MDLEVPALERPFDFVDDRARDPRDRIRLHADREVVPVGHRALVGVAAARLLHVAGLAVILGDDVEPVALGPHVVRAPAGRATVVDLVGDEALLAAWLTRAGTGGDAADEVTDLAVHGVAAWVHDVVPLALDV